MLLTRGGFASADGDKFRRWCSALCLGPLAVLFGLVHGGECRSPAHPGVNGSSHQMPDAIALVQRCLVAFNHHRSILATASSQLHLGKPGGCLDVIGPRGPRRSRPSGQNVTDKMRSAPRETLAPPRDFGQVLRTSVEPPCIVVMLRTHQTESEMRSRMTS